MIWRRALITANIITLLLFSWYAYARITTPPADGWPTSPEQSGDSLGNFQRQLQRIPAPPWKVPPPKNLMGLQYVGGAARPVAELGPSDPNNNPLLIGLRDPAPLPPAVADYLLDTRAVADQLRRMVTDGLHHANTTALRQLRTLFAAHMDAAARAGDRKTSMQYALALWRTSEASLFVNRRRHRPSRFGNRAIGNVLRRYPARPAESSDLLNAVGASKRDLRTSVVIKRKLGLTDLDAFLDRHYTRDSAGNGWLVVSTVPKVGEPNRPPATNNNRLWNLLSAFPYSRAQMKTKLQQLCRGIHQADAVYFNAESDSPLSYGNWNFGEGMRLYWDLLAGPIPNTLHRGKLRSPLETLLLVEMRRNLHVMLQLANHRAEHGRYPEATPQLIKHWPISLYGGRPFRYEVTTDGQSYTLRDPNFTRITPPLPVDKP